MVRAPKQFIFSSSSIDSGPAVGIEAGESFDEAAETPFPYDTPECRLDEWPTLRTLFALEERKKKTPVGFIFLCR